MYEYSIFAMDMVGRRSMELDICAFGNFSDSLLLNISRSFKVGNFTTISPLLFWRVFSTRSHEWIQELKDLILLPVGKMDFS